MRGENDFKTNDRVRHVSRDEVGTVIVLSNGDIRVEFDKRTPRGNRSVGVYDPNWFRVYPNGLILEPDTGSVT